MSKNITLLGTNYPSVPQVQLPQTGGGTATFTDVSDTTATASDVAQGKIFFLADGSQATGTSSGGGGSTKNVQAYQGMDYARASSYTATDVTLTVEKSGTYNISWMGFRNTTSGTSGSRLYVNGTAEGTAHTSFTSSYGQHCEETLSLSEGDVLDVRARARSSSYYMYVGNLVIEEQ